jgi:hypothetical protein
MAEVISDPCDACGKGVIVAEVRATDLRGARPGRSPEALACGWLCRACLRKVTAAMGFQGDQCPASDVSKIPDEDVLDIFANLETDE